MATPTELMAALIAEASTLVTTFKNMSTTITTTLNNALAATDVAVKSKIDTAIAALTASTNFTGTFYVDAVNGSDTNNGTTNLLPFKTMAKALSMTAVFKETNIYIKVGQVHRVAPQANFKGSVFISYFNSGFAPIAPALRHPTQSLFVSTLAPNDWNLHRSGTATLRFCLENAAGELVDSYPESIGTSTPAQWYAANANRRTPGFSISGAKSDIRLVCNGIHIELPVLSEIPNGYYKHDTMRRTGIFRFADHYSYILGTFINCTIRTGGSRLMTGAGGTAQTAVQWYGTFIYLPNALLPEDGSISKAMGVIDNSGITWSDRTPSNAYIWEDGTALTSNEAMAITFQSYIWPTTGVAGVDAALPPSNILLSTNLNLNGLTRGAYTAGIASIKPRLIVKDPSYFLIDTPV